MRTQERGSVVGYILGVVLLLAVLLGGIALYKNYATKSNSSDNQVANDQKTTDDKAAQNEAALKKQQEEAANKAANDQKTADTATDSSVKQVPTTSTVPTDNLPQTGASDTLLAMVGGAALAGATVAYIRSRANL